jgi:hypothetical protein
MFKSRWARVAALSLIGLSIPVLAAAKQRVSKHSAKPVSKATTTSVVKSSKQSSAKPLAATHKKSASKRANKLHHKTAKHAKLSSHRRHASAAKSLTSAHKPLAK